MIGNTSFLLFDRVSFFFSSISRRFFFSSLCNKEFQTDVTHCEIWAARTDTWRFQRIQYHAAGGRRIFSLLAHRDRSQAPVASSYDFVMRFRYFRSTLEKLNNSYAF